MKIRWTTSWASQDGQGDPSMPPFDIGEEQGRKYIRMGWAEEVMPARCPHCGKSIETEVLETATVGAGAETATLPRGARR